jgi:hypothetical protein
MASFNFVEGSINRITRFIFIEGSINRMASLIFVESSINRIPRFIFIESSIDRITSERTSIYIDPPKPDRMVQCRQVFVGATRHQSWEKIPNDYKVCLFAITYTKHAKWLYMIPPFSIPSPANIFPNFDFWYSNIPSRKPATTV